MPPMSKGLPRQVLLPFLPFHLELEEQPKNESRRQDQVETMGRVLSHPRSASGYNKEVTDKPAVTFVLGNRRTKVLCEPEIQLKLKEHFRFRPKGYFFSQKYRMHVWDGWIQMLQRGTVATGLVLDKLEKLKEQFDVTVEDKRTYPIFRKTEIEARDYQYDCLTAMQKAS